MIKISLFYWCFKWNNENFNIILNFDHEDSKEENYKYFGGKVNTKTWRKSWKLG